MRAYCYRERQCTEMSDPKVGQGGRSGKNNQIFWSCRTVRVGRRRQQMNDFKGTRIAGLIAFALVSQTLLGQTTGSKAADNSKGAAPVQAAAAATPAKDKTPKQDPPGQAGQTANPGQDKTPKQ